MGTLVLKMIDGNAEKGKRKSLQWHVWAGLPENVSALYLAGTSISRPSSNLNHTCGQTRTDGAINFQVSRHTKDRISVRDTPNLQEE